MAGRWDTEDWTMQLAAMGACDEDLTAGADDEVREQKAAVLEERKTRLQDAAQKRGKTADVASLKEKNRAALEKLRKNRAALLPEGWKMVESRSRPGDYVYENVFTEERQAWMPTEPAIDPAKVKKAAGTEKKKKSGVPDHIKEKNRKALEARKARGDTFVPEGWKRVPSASRPGEFVYENIYTEERISWFPVANARKEAMPEQAPAVSDDAEKVKALYDFSRSSTEEIDLEEGDVLVVEYKADNGWWVGTNTRTGQLGMFPGSFTEPN
eukprot:m.37135 g.37135  ORF g.37135 m.37135 type:complete len:269 (-) comp11077_c0_seq1:90-896(-)